MKRRTPRGPEGVSLRYADGAEFMNLPVIFDGWENGTAVFSVLSPRDELPVSCDIRMLPAKTSVRFPALDGFVPPVDDDPDELMRDGW